MQQDRILLVTLEALTYPWCADDAAWFTKNPSRAHRVRSVFPDEFPKELHAQSDYVVVRHVKPGVRARLPITPHEKFRDAPEHVAHAIFDLAYNASPNESVSVQKINKRAAELRKAARFMQ